jgi:hypothetical protein
VQVSLSVFRTGILFFVLLVYLGGCSDIPRDNLLDPKNKNSIRPRLVTLDVFVNTANDFQYNQYLLGAIDQLQQKYEGQLTVAEYHRHTADYSDSLFITDNELLYNTYMAYYGPDSKGVPDVFMNGTAKRVQGASSVSTAFTRLEQALQPLLLQNSFFTIEPQIDDNGSQVHITVKVARLGSTNAQDVLIKMILTEQVDQQYLKRVVRRILKSDVIPTLSAGEMKEVEFYMDNLAGSANYTVLINVTSADELEVFQSIKMSLP